MGSEDPVVVVRHTGRLRASQLDHVLIMNYTPQQFRLQ